MLRIASFLIFLPVFALVLTAACSSTDDTSAEDSPDPVVDTSPAAPLVSDEEVPPQDLLDPNRIVARVNDEIITVRSIQAVYGDVLLTIGEPTDRRYRQVLYELSLKMIVNRLFLQAASRLGVSISREDLQRVVQRAEEQLKKRDTTLDEDLRDRGIARWEWEEEQRKNLLIEKYNALAVGQGMPLTPEQRAVVDPYVRPMEIRGFYERNIVRYQREEEARIGAIFIRVAKYAEPGVSAAEAEQAARTDAELLVGRARGGESFSELVLEVHDAPLDQFKEPIKRGTQRDFIENFVWSAAVGQVSDPILTPSGILILKLKERHAARVLPYSEAKDDILQQIRILKFTVSRLKVQIQLLKESVVEPAAFKRDLKSLLRAETEDVLNALSI